MASKMASVPQTATPTTTDEKKPQKATWLDTLQMNPKMYWPKKYRYSIEPYPGTIPILSIQQRDHYEANGYIIIKNILPKQVIERFKTKVSSISSRETQDEVLKEYIRLPELLRIVQGFCGPSIMAVDALHLGNEEVDEKGDNNVQYRNLFSIPLRPADRIVSSWTPIKDSTKFSLSSGSHKSGGLYSSESESSETVIFEPVPRDTSTKKEVLLNAGDTLLFHPLLSYALPQKALSLFANFASSDCQFVEYMEGRDESLIPPHMKESARLPLADWKEKVIFVHGQRSSL